MGTSCLTACTSCQRHVRCGERVCPFCGAQVTTHYRALEYRLKNRLSRGRAFSLGAALAAAGFAVSCDDDVTVAPPYGVAAVAGTDRGTSGAGGSSPSSGGVASAGSSSSGGALVTPGGAGSGAAGGSSDEAAGGVGGESSGGAAGADSGGSDSGASGAG